jgi:hypothetical protein
MVVAVVRRIASSINALGFLPARTAKPFSIFTIRVSSGDQVSASNIAEVDS